MSWFRVDDTLAAHPKTRRAGLAAMGLWTVAGSWSSQQLTEGFIPDWFVATWPQGKKLAEQLVRAGYWEPAEDDNEQGWQFHDWTDANPTAEREKERRRKARERQRKLRERSAEKREEALDKALDEDASRSTSRVTGGVSHGAPTRPVPTRSSSPTEKKQLPSKTSGGSGTEVDAGESDGPPRCIRHNKLNRYDEPPCKSCERLRLQWEQQRTADAVFDRKPWCGECNAHTRLRTDDHLDVVYRCPECHPRAEEAIA